MDKEREDKILEAIGRQRQDIVAHVDKQLSSVINKLEKHDEQFGSIREDLSTMKSELNSVKNAVMENGINIKEVKVEVKELKNSVDTAVTNHESRIRRLEEKVGT